MTDRLRLKREESPNLLPSTYSVEGIQASTYKSGNAKERHGHDFSQLNMDIDFKKLGEKSVRAYAVLTAIHFFQEVSESVIAKLPISKIGLAVLRAKTSLDKIIPGISLLIGGYEVNHSLFGEHGFLKDHDNPDSLAKLGKGAAGLAEVLAGLSAVLGFLPGVAVGKTFAGSYAIGEEMNEATDSVLGGKGHSALDILAFDPLTSKLGDSIGNFNETLANKIVGVTNSAENLLNDENEQEREISGSVDPLRRMLPNQQENHRPRIYPPFP